MKIDVTKRKCASKKSTPSGSDCMRTKKSCEAFRLILTVTAITNHSFISPVWSETEKKLQSESKACMFVCVTVLLAYWDLNSLKLLLVMP